MIFTEQSSSKHYLGISKSELAKKLDVSRNTLLRFHNKFALELIPDYFNSFPQLNGQSRFDLPLSDYQAWVLSKLIRSYLNTPTFLIEVDLSKESVIEDYDYQSFAKTTV